MKCARCETINPSHAEFCLRCGRPIDGGAPAAKSYADLQAENEELRRSLGEASEQRTATAEILQIISTSITDLRPVLDAVVERAARLCAANDAVIFRADRDTLTPVATCGVPAVSSVPRTRGTASGRAIVDRQPVHVEDLASPTSIAEFPDANVPRARGIRTQLAVPLLKEDEALGVILIRRFQVQPFSEQQIALIKTFADQAVIAIENVRLFNELEARNRDLTESLDQQTATSEILRVISRSRTDLQAVLETVLHSAGRLCTAAFGAVQLFDGTRLTLDAHYGISPDDVAMLQEQVFPMYPDRGSTVGRAVLSRAVVHVADIRADPDFRFTPLQIREGYRTALSVPMLGDGVVVGVINLWRRDVRPFSDSQVRLVETFADQAVIAIENVRLFTELQQKNEALTQAHAQVTESLEQQTA